MILAPAAMAAESDPKIAAAKCFEACELDPDMYRIGHTKACRAPAGSGLAAHPCFSQSEEPSG